MLLPHERNEKKQRWPRCIITAAKQQQEPVRMFLDRYTLEDAHIQMGVAVHIFIRKKKKMITRTRTHIHTHA